MWLVLSLLALSQWVLFGVAIHVGSKWKNQLLGLKEQQKLTPNRLTAITQMRVRKSL